MIMQFGMSKRKNPGNRQASGVFDILKLRSALAELRSAAGGFEAVLKGKTPETLDFTGFFGSSLYFSPASKSK